MARRFDTYDLASPRGPGVRALAAWWPHEAAEAVRVSLTAIAAIWLSMWLEFDAPQWAGWTVLSVTLSTRAASLEKSLWRAGATIVGVAVAIALVANFAQATLAFDIALAVWLGLATAASTIESGQRSYGFALMGFTVPIITLADVQHPEHVFDLGIDRCSTILVGVGCAYASNVLVAPGVAAVARDLAGRIEAAADACAAWIASVRSGGEPGPMPVAPVIGLAASVGDAFREQPSLRWGGRPIQNAPRRLRWTLAAGLLHARLPDRDEARALDLLGRGHARTDRQIARLRVTARLLRRGGRIGRRPIAFRPHLLLWTYSDWDGRHALNNGLRSFATAAIVNGFWYATSWIHGSGAATWACLLCLLQASHPDPIEETRAFIVGAALAAVVGLTVRYTLLTMTGAFGLLAAVMLPICMLSVIGRSDKRAVYGVGFGFFVFGVIDPTNVMTFDLGDSLNTVLAELLGMGVAVVAFSSLPPPVSQATRELRARRRLVRGVRVAALDPAAWLPPADRYLARAFGRLGAIGGDARVDRTGQTLLLVGLLLLALRETDERTGRRAGRLAWTVLAGGADADAARAALGRLGGEAGLAPLPAGRLAAIAALVDLPGAGDRAGWPDLARSAAR